MVDDFMVCVDRIIASACFNSADERVRLLSGAGAGDELAAGAEKHLSFVAVEGSNGGGEGCSKTARECRICQEEDEEHEMESPCACNGTLKYAHRKCIQKWCNKKGDITCEICNQVYSPNYSIPTRSKPDVMAIDIRQTWGPHIDFRDPNFMALTAAERQFLQSEYEEYAIANSGSMACFRYVAIILMLILLTQQALMLTREFGMVRQASTYFNFQVSLLQLAGFLLPCYVMARYWYIIQSRRRRQVMS